MTSIATQSIKRRVTSRRESIAMAVLCTVYFCILVLVGLLLPSGVTAFSSCNTKPPPKNVFLSRSLRTTKCHVGCSSKPRKPKPRSRTTARNSVSETTAASVLTTNDLNEEKLQDIWTVATAQHAADVSMTLRDTTLAADIIDANKENGDAFEKDVPPFKWYHSSHVAGKSLPVIGTVVPVLNEEACRTVLKSAQDYWDHHESQDQESKFTLQGIHKREVHVADLDKEAVHVINKSLSVSIFPLIRHVFGGKNNQDAVVPDSCSLVLYDALIIEYDATSLTNEDQESLEKRPSQPLHRDLGLVSVNVALDCPNTGFTGGGTVFERLLKWDAKEEEEKGLLSEASLLPRGTGHALLHPSRERHAGGALNSGKRTIMVFFVTAADLQSEQPSETNTCQNTPKLELVARCMSLGMSLADDKKFIPIPNKDTSLSGIEDRIACYQAATHADPQDGEAWLYLAMALMQQAAGAGSLRNTQEKAAAHENILHCLENARQWNPADGRTYNTLGLALKDAYTILEKNESNELHQDKEQINQDIISNFGTAALLFERATRAGCKGANVEARSSLLNWGLWHANRNEFSQAVQVLSRMFDTKEFKSAVKDDHTDANQEGGDSAEQATRVVRDAKRLLEFCRTATSRHL